MSTMPGEQVDHVFAGQMGPETIHFLEVVHPDTARDGDARERAHASWRPTARPTFGRRNEPIDLPLTNESISAIADFKKKIRAGLNN